MRKRRTDGQRGRGRAEKTNAECDGARAKCKCAAAVRVANYEFKGKIIALGGLARWRRPAAVAEEAGCDCSAEPDSLRLSSLPTDSAIRIN